MNSQIVIRLLFGCLACLLSCFTALSQVYTGSGSTGSDGPLTFPNAHPGDVIIFNPATYGPQPLDPSNDGIFNFTNITVPTGVTVKLVGSIINHPVYWLATGNVDIEGTLDLSGANGTPQTSLPSIRVSSIPGPGGYPGGVGGGSSSQQYPSQNGLGPAGGKVQACDCGWSCGGGLGANNLLIPLFGGSGGGGYPGNPFGPGGGAGGGAILIASSTQIIVNGSLISNGGATDPNSGNGAGGGGGGAIRLLASGIAGTGSIKTIGGASNGCSTAGTTGTIRLEAYNQNFTGSLSGNVQSGTPYATFVPSGTNVFPTLKVISVAGVAVNPNPTGSFTVPDVTINSSAAVPVVVQATDVPVGTVVKLQFWSENGPDISVNTPGLVGTLQSSTATANVQLPPGFSHGFVTATFTTAQ